MTYKQTRKYFLAAISFLAFGILFSCKNQNKNDVPDEKKEEFVITFGASPENEGSVVATLDGNPIKSGVTKVSKGKEVVFTLTISNSNAYELEDWDGGAVKDSSNPLMAKLTVSSNTTVTAKLKTKKPDPELTLASLKLYKTDINISNLSDIKIEVDNLVPILRSTDVDAEFTYGEQTTPKRIDVNVDKGKLNIGLNTIKLSVQAVPGEYKYWEQEIKITRKEGDTPSVAIPAEARLESIEVAIVAEKKGKAKVEEFKPLEGFNGEESGPYAMEEAKTAYIELNVKVAKPSSGEFTIQAVNKTTYIAPVAFSRKSGDQEGYFKKNRIVLSKGLNVIEVKVKSPDGSKEGIYTIVVQYGGGPDPSTLEMKDRNIIPGIYCPTQRKHLDGEKPDYVLLMAIAGW